MSAGFDRQVTVQPTTRYAGSGTVNIAYQVVGDGPRDLVHVGGSSSGSPPSNLLSS